MKFLILALMMDVYCGPTPEVGKTSAERILRTLSDDAMKGRKTFTPDIERAAGFLISEFERMGLRPLPGSGSFLQSFRSYEISTDSAVVVLNGVTVPRQDIFSTADRERVDWSDKDSVAIIVVGPNDQARSVLRFVMSNPGTRRPTLVLIDPAHEKLFRRYQTFYGRHSHLAIGQEPPALFVLTKAGKPVAFTAYAHQRIESKPLANVVGILPGKRNDEFVLYSAHYDHIGVLEPVSDDSIANGADDDASGVTAVLMIADSLRNTNPERTLVFALFTAEEIGGFGSEYLAKTLDPRKIAVMVNIEMIGKPSKFGPATAYITGFDKSDFGTLMQNDLKGTGYEVFPDPYPKENLFYRSDNANFAQLGVPAHTVSTSQMDKDEYYHTVDDELQTIDLDHLTSVIRGIILGTRGFVNGSATPKRIPLE